MEILSASLRGKIEPIDSVSFVRAEWAREAPQFVLLKYEIEDKEQEFGVRMDLDKRILMEDLDDPALNYKMRERSNAIWSVVVETINHGETA
jgi:hypothetical protein